MWAINENEYFSCVTLRREEGGERKWISISSIHYEKASQPLDQFHTCGGSQKGLGATF
jgi:hypothetical protein